MCITYLSNCFLCTDLVFVMDSTSSMGPYISSALNNIYAIVEEIVVSEKSDVHLALVEYRDHPPQVSIKSRGVMFSSNISFYLGSYFCHTRS